MAIHIWILGAGVARWQREDSRDWSFYKRPFTIYFLEGSGEFRIFQRVPTYHSAKISWKMEKIGPSYGGGGVRPNFVYVAPTLEGVVVLSLLKFLNDCIKE